MKTQTQAALRRTSELLIVGVSGLALSAEETAILQRLEPGGVILFRRNVESADQLHSLVAEIRRAAPRTVLSVDAEGGRVDRLAPLAGPAVSAELLAAGPPRLSRQAGFWMGQAVANFGFDVDYAPVVDLDLGLAGNALDGRYFGALPRAVAARAGAFLDGLRAAGVAGCLKHFPGLGPSQGDTHFETGLVDFDLAAMQPHLEPYRRLGSRAGMVMVSHAAYPAMDAEGLPASLSVGLVDGLLRRDLEFSGVAMADDLEMHALTPFGSLTERARRALEAGCDLLPLCHSTGAAEEVAAGLGEPSLDSRVEVSRRRLEIWRRRHLRSASATGRRYTLATIQQRLARVAAAGGRLAESPATQAQIQKGRR